MTWVQGRISALLGDAAHPMLPTFGQARRNPSRTPRRWVAPSPSHTSDWRRRCCIYERVRHYRATRFQLGSKFAFDHLRARDTSEQKALLEKLDERVSPAFAHDKRGGEDNSWIYAYDARNIGAELPPKRLGPWDFRRAAKAGHYAAITRGSLEANGPRQRDPSPHARRGRPAQHARQLLGHHRGKGLTTSPSGHRITLAAPELPGCTPARKPPPNSVTTIGAKLWRIWLISTYGDLVETQAALP